MKVKFFLCPHAAVSGAVSASCSPSSQSGCSRLGSALYSISATLQPQLSMLQSCCSRYYRELAVRMIYRTLYFIASAIYFAMSAPVSSHAAADIAEWTQFIYSKNSIFLRQIQRAGRQ